MPSSSQQPDSDINSNQVERAEDELADDHTLTESDGSQHRRFKLQRDLAKRLDRYLRDRLPNLSRSRLQKLINEGAVKVNDKTPKASTILHDGDIVDVIAPPPTIKKIPADQIPLQILYEDEHLVVVNKQADLVTHPARSNTRGTLVNALAWYYRDIDPNGLEALSSIGVNEFRPGIVHRLDKDTTGAIVVAKTDTAHSNLQQQFEKRNVQKYYLAIVHGEMNPPGDAIDQPIGKHPTVAEAYAVRNDSFGRDSVTLYRVREIFDGYSLVELELKTGRTHQIRVHLTWLGFPIVSDIIYGGQPVGPEDITNPSPPAGAQPYLTYARNKTQGLQIWNQMDTREDLLIRRQALHATVLQFKHPVTHQTIDITAPLHDDMAILLRSLRKHAPGDGIVENPGAIVDLDKILPD